MAYFSLVIPTYNRGHLIGSAIHSVLVQSFADFELIIVDDGSTDDTEAVVKKHNDIRIHYYKKQNGERGAARNFGVDAAQGKYVNFLDSDDVVYPNHLTVAYELIQRNQAVEIFHLSYDIKNIQGKLLSLAPKITSINHQILSGNLLSCNGVFIRKDVIEKNRFNEDRSLSSMEDWELWIRLAARYTFRHDHQITSTVIQHDQRSVMTVSTAKIKQKLERFIYCILHDEVNQQRFGRGLNKAVASALTYAALHLMLAGEKKKIVFLYLLKGIRKYSGELMKRRFLVILKGLSGF